MPSHRVDRDSLVDEISLMRDTASRLRRRHHYMCRNTTGDYSIKDLMLITFAAETADSLAHYLSEQQVLRREATQRNVMKRRLAELLSQDPIFTKIDTLRLVDIVEEDDRYRIMEMEKIELQEAVNRPPPNYREIKRQTDLRNRAVSHVVWYETAQREDIISGENQDFDNLVSAMPTPSPSSK